MSEIIKAFNWPFAVLVFSVIFCIIFRKSIVCFINRIGSVSKDGIKADLPNQIAPEEKSVENIERLMSISAFSLINVVEDKIKKDLIENHVESQDDKIRVLTRHLAIAHIAVEFEAIYGAIFGSQISLLKKLNELGEGGCEDGFLVEYFNIVKGRFLREFDGWGKERYLAFLFSVNLIELTVDRIAITKKGQDFLSWLVLDRRSENRAL